MQRGPPPVPLWLPWFEAVRCLRPACARLRTFLWMVLTFIGLSCRNDLVGVTSYQCILALSDWPITAFCTCSTAPGWI
jgi:hypothetical protein